MTWDEIILILDICHPGNNRGGGPRERRRRCNVMFCFYELTVTIPNRVCQMSPMVLVYYLLNALRSSKPCCCTIMPVSMCTAVGITAYPFIPESGVGVVASVTRCTHPRLARLARLGVLMLMLTLMLTLMLMHPRRQGDDDHSSRAKVLYPWVNLQGTVDLLFLNRIRVGLVGYVKAYAGCCAHDAR